MKKLFAVLFLSAALLFGCGGSEKDVLKVGMELAYPPFEMTDLQGEPTRISVDLAYALGEFLGRPVEIRNVSFDGLIPSLKTGKIDLIISSMTITEERRQSVEFSDPYSKAYLSLLISKDSPVKKADDLNVKGRKVAVKKGTTGHLYAKEHFPKADIMLFDKESSCVIEVVQKKADAFIYDQMTIFKNWSKNKDTTRAILEPFQEDYEYWGMAMRKDDIKMREKANKFLRKFKEEGGFKKLGEKYLSEQKKTFEELGIPFFFSP